MASHICCCLTRSSWLGPGPGLSRHGDRVPALKPLRARARLSSPTSDYLEVLLPSTPRPSAVSAHQRVSRTLHFKLFPAHVHQPQLPQYQFRVSCLIIVSRPCSLTAVRKSSSFRRPVNCQSLHAVSVTTLPELACHHIVFLSFPCLPGRGRAGGGVRLFCTRASSRSVALLFFFFSPGLFPLLPARSFLILSVFFSVDLIVPEKIALCYLRLSRLWLVLPGPRSEHVLRSPAQPKYKISTWTQHQDTGRVSSFRQGTGTGCGVVAGAGCVA